MWSGETNMTPEELGRYLSMNFAEMGTYLSMGIIVSMQ
jgi:hypothetical protein